MIKHGYDITPRLMNSEYNSAIVVPRQRHETFHNVVRIKRIQPLKENNGLISKHVDKD
jgi:hypothetical protein